MLPQKFERPKRVSKAQLNKVIEAHIRKSDRAPKNWNRIEQVAKETATDLKVKGKKFNIPWGLLLILIPGLIGIYLAFTSRKRPEGEGGIALGKRPDEPIDLKGKDVRELLDDFGYKREGGQGDGGPFD